MSTKLFSELGLSEEILKAVQRLGFEQASPIQAEAIPVLMTGKDIVGQSQTGSGKTAAFAIPAIERMDPKATGPQVLILCPTRELAIQVSEEVHKLAFFKRGVKPLPIYGGQSYERQFSGLRAGANVIIGTPGRIIDHIDRKTLQLGGIKTVILDEADEMLNMGFRDDIEKILSSTPPERQTVMFSATVPRPIEELIARYTRQPVRVRIEAKALTVPTIEQVYFEVDRRWKFEALTRLIDLHDVTLAIIFANTQRVVNELTEQLMGAGYTADCIHGGMPQASRDRVMSKFRSGGLRFLVATDVAARGIDVDDIQVVFNFDLPYDAEDYVHRIGRTGRAGRSGIGISFASGREVFLIRDIERFTRQRIRRGEIPSTGEIEDARRDQFLKSLRETLQAGDFRHYDHVIEALLEEGFDSLDVTSAAIHRLVSKPNEESSKTAKPAKVAKAPAAAGTPAPTGVATPTAPSPAALVPPHDGAPTAPRPALPSASAKATVAPKAAAAPKTTPATFEAPARKFEPRAVEPVRADRVKHEFPRTPKPSAPAPVPFVPPAVPKTSAVIPVAAPVPPRPRTPKPAVSATPSLATNSNASFPTAAAAVTSPIPRAPKAPPAPVAPRANEAEAVDSKSPVTEPTVGATRLWISTGEENGTTVESLRDFILGTTGEPATSLGRIDIRERHSFVDVPGDRAASFVSRLKRAEFGGKRVKAKVA
jgi:ATP-dependent RNA helicase DeaD